MKPMPADTPRDDAAHGRTAVFMTRASDNEDMRESEAAAQWAALEAHRGRLVGDGRPGTDAIVDGEPGEGDADAGADADVDAGADTDAVKGADAGRPDADAPDRDDAAPRAAFARGPAAPSWRAATMPRIDRAPMPELAWTGVRASLRAGLQGPAPTGREPQAWERAAVARRRRLLAVVAVASVLATATLSHSRAGSAHPLLQALQIGLFALLFAWVAAGCVTAVMGFLVLLRGDRHALSARTAGAGPIPAHVRTALVMPICHEDVATVFGGLRATCESLKKAGAWDAFDVFVLSDSSDPALRAQEREAFARLRETLGADARLYYRCRVRRTRRKAGNVADFCRRWGKGYDYMVVLDADSVMSGDCLHTLVKLMEQHPTAGILQTAPQAVGHATLHARAQQFASRVTGRLFTAGMQYWQLGEAHYWGHNAIIRVKPFMQHCALAPLPGTGALAGDILSHDFVEAALMRRAGFHVWLVPDLVGSYEQQPPNLLAELQRDRRWCQGNLQNARLIAEPGLHAVHRGMLATGAMAYASAPLWLAYVALGALLWWTGDNVLFGPDGRLALGGAALWFGTLAMLVAPRLLGVFAVLWRGEAAQYGGGVSVLWSAMLESALSVLLAPLRMVAHTLFVVGALTGWKLDWKSPPREANDVRWSEAAQRFGGVSLAMAALAAGFALVAPSALVWLAPIGVPLLLAVPFTVWTASSRLGRRVRDARLLLVPEEARSPAVLRRAWGYARERVSFAFAG
jgi:membrane glycosyltransferase